jgi:hypothetical protein
MSDRIRHMLAAEAEAAERQAEMEERGEAKPAAGQRARRSAADPAQVYSVRIPVARLEELRRVAEELGEPPSALLRRWALERLDQELGHASRNRDRGSRATSLQNTGFSEDLRQIVRDEVDKRVRASAGSRSGVRLGPTRRLLSDDSPATGLASASVDVKRARGRTGVQ